MEWVEDRYYIKNQKVWDATVKKVHELQKQHAEAKRGAFRRAFDLGLADGKTGKKSQAKELAKFPELLSLPGGGVVTILELSQAYERGFTFGSSRQRAKELGIEDSKKHGKFARKDEMKSWDAVKNGVLREEELFIEYRDAFNTQNKARAKLMDRAGEQGWEDGKTGTKAHIDDIFKWPETKKLLSEGADMQDLFAELVERYNHSFDIKTGKKDQYEGLDDDD